MAIERTLAPAAAGPGSPPQVRVWWAIPEEIGDPALLARYRAALSEEERARAARFRFDEHRHTFVVAHALLRSCLSRCAAVAPEEWQFTANKHGRPELAGPPGAPDLRFNLSHTSGLVACAVHEASDVGCDVEDQRSVRPVLELADRFFAPSEAAALRALEPAAQMPRFTEYWTLKEAYVKARGLGLRLPLASFAFALGASSIAIRFEPSAEDDPQRWRFALYRPTPHHVLALAVQRDRDGHEPQIHVSRCIPLRD